MPQSTATLEADMRALLDAEAEVKLRVRILHELRGQLTRGDKIVRQTPLLALSRSAR